MSLFFKLLVYAGVLCLFVTPGNSETDRHTHPFQIVEDLSDLQILTPALSDRKTAKIRLENGLEAYLVSDPHANQSGVALAVEAGSWDDPEEYPGMAHFLEHMLFMGTIPYPDESEYMRYIGDHGGQLNAFTAADRTVYMFSINHEAFAGALDRFAHFFIDPLFSPGSISRELHAVDQEHAKNIENDGWRQYMVFKETGNVVHPNAKFSTGNAQTLGGIPPEAMKAWYENHYASSKMHVVVFSKEPIETLISLTSSTFSQVPLRSSPAQQSSLPMMSEQQLGQLVFIKPIKDIKLLALSWELPSDLGKDKETKSGPLIAYALESGSKNGLLSFLKKEHLAEGIHAAQEQLAKGHTLFNIEIQLTDKGIREVDKVITHCFQALARMQKTPFPRYLFDEMEQVSQTQYAYQSRENVFEFVLETVRKLVDEDLETFPRKTQIPTRYDATQLSRYLTHLQADNCLFFVLGDPNKTGVIPTKIEKWMGVEYEIKAPKKEEMRNWLSGQIHPEIGIPPPNPFLPSNLTLLSPLDRRDSQIVPILLQNDERGTIYFAQDHQYLVPEVRYLMRIKSPLIDGSVRSKILTDLYLQALGDALFPILSAARAMGVDLFIREERLSLHMGVDGYNRSADAVLKEMLSAMHRIHPTQEQFQVYKQSLQASYADGAKELPLMQSYELLSTILFSSFHSHSEKLESLQQIEYRDLVQFSREVLRKTYTEGFFYGNLTEEEAKLTAHLIEQQLSAESYPPSQHHLRGILLLPEGQGPYMVSHATSMLGNAALLAIEEGASTLEKQAQQQLLGMILKDAFFDTLRTKQQTAYIARAFEREEEKRLFQFFAVQSNTHEPAELIARFELFLENFIKQFSKKFPLDRFENIKKTAITSLLRSPENLKQMSNRLFSLAFDNGADFDLMNKRIEALKQVSYEQIQIAAEAFFSRENTRRIAILIEGNLPKEREFRYELVSKELLRQGQYVVKGIEISH